MVPCTEPAVTVRDLATAQEMRAGVELYRQVFELSADDPAVSPRLLAALQHNGGSALGAFADRALVGFVYGFVGIDPVDDGQYHYSQMSVVRPDFQGRGVGRALKLGQRDRVLRTGITAMRWAYDPVRSQNAHFNLDVLGARGRWFVADMYGVEDSGRDPGVQTDRLIVEWDLTGAPNARTAQTASGGTATSDRERSDPLALGEHRRTQEEALFVLPADWEQFVRADAARASSLRRHLAAVFVELLDEGYTAVSCQRQGPEHAVYRLTRRA